MSVQPVPMAQQARSRLTQQRILDAAFEVVEHGGIEALTVSAIAASAGVAVGSVYRRFGDKEALLLAVQGAYAEQVRDDVASRLARLDRSAAKPEEVLEHAVRSVVGAFARHQKLLGVFLTLGLSNPAVFEAGSRSSTGSKETFEQFLVDVPLRRTDRDASLDFAFRLLYAALAHRVTQGEHLESERPLPWADLEDHLVDAIVSYLLHPAPVRSRRG